MPTWTFIKKGGAPAGTVNIKIGNDSFLIDDTANSTITVTDPLLASELASHPYVQPQGATGALPAAQNVQNVAVVNGVLSTYANGVWTPVPFGVELGYAEYAVDGNSAGVTTPTDIPGLAVTVTVTSRPIIVEFHAPLAQQGTSGKLPYFQLTEDGATIGTKSTLAIFPAATGASVVYAPVTIKRRRTPSAGSHTYKVQWWSDTGGYAGIWGVAYGPAFLQVTEK